MIGASAMHALGGSPLRLLGDSALLPGALFSRASAGMGTAADGTVAPAATDAPRFNAATRRLILEGARTNAIRNPRGEGSAASTPPANWTVLTSGGLSRSYAAISENGMQGVRIRVFGTATGTSCVIGFDTTTGIPAAAGQIWTESVFLRLADSTALPDATQLTAYQRDSSGNSIANTASLSITPTASIQRFAVTRTLTADAATASAVPTLRFLTTSGVSYDFKVDVFWPQFELGLFASTPILPPAGTPAAATRAADAASLALGAAQRTAGTLLGQFLLPAAGAVERGLFCLHDGTSARLLALRANAAGQLQPTRAAGGTTTAGAAGTTLPVGIPFRAALAWDATGLSCAALGTVQALAGAPPAITTLGIGAGDAVGAIPLFGEAGGVTLYPTRLSDTALQALTTG